MRNIALYSVYQQSIKYFAIYEVLGNCKVVKNVIFNVVKEWPTKTTTTVRRRYSGNQIGTKSMQSKTCLEDSIVALSL